MYIFHAPAISKIDLKDIYVVFPCSFVHFER